MKTKSINYEIIRNTNFFVKVVQRGLDLMLTLHWVHINISFIAYENLTALIASNRLVFSYKHSVTEEHTLQTFASKHAIVCRVISR